MSERSHLMSTIIRAVAIELAVDEDVVAAARSLKQELAMDSVAAANILFRLEEELNVELDPAVVDRIEVLNDLEVVLEEAIRKLDPR